MRPGRTAQQARAWLGGEWAADTGVGAVRDLFVHVVSRINRVAIARLKAQAPAALPAASDRQAELAFRLSVSRERESSIHRRDEPSDIDGEPPAKRALIGTEL